MGAKKKIKPIKSTTHQVNPAAIQKEPNSIPSKSQLPQIPQIEIKGNKINETQSMTVAAAATSSSFMSKNLNYIDALENSVLFKKPELKMNDSFNVSTAFTSKPYQLSKPVPCKRDSPKTSDFIKNNIVHLSLKIFFN